MKLTPMLAKRARLRQFQIVVTVADKGSLLQAALALGISQPSVTKAVTAVEEIVGTPIFDRLPRGVIPNEFGKAFISGARRIIAETARVETDIVRISEGLSGSLEIGSLTTAAAGLLPAVLPRFRQLYPDISVSVTDGHTDGLLPILQTGGLDLIVGRLYETDVKDDLRREVLYNEPLGIICRSGHPLLDRLAVERFDIENSEFALPSSAQRVSQDVDRAIQESQLSIGPPLRSSSLTFIREYILAGDALTILPRMMLVGDLMRASLEVVPYPLAQLDRPAGVIMLRHRQMSMAQKAFVGVLRDYLRSSTHAERATIGEFAVSGYGIP